VGTTTIYVTHDQVEAMAMGDRVMVLNKVWFASSALAHQMVYDNPADTFVATFLGSPPMNLAEIGDVIVGFRPEHFRPASTVTGDSVPFRLKVENIDTLVGVDRFRHLRLAGSLKPRKSSRASPRRRTSTGRHV